MSEADILVEMNEMGFENDEDSELDFLIEMGLV
jgi:hypothetical protein